MKNPPKPLKLEDKPLEPKQKAFLAEYVKDHNAGQAGIRAGYGGPDIDPTKARQRGYEILKKPAAQAYLKRLEYETAKKLGIDKQTISVELDAALARAIENGNLQAEIRAIELKGKLVGAFTEVVDMNHHITAEMVQSMERVLEDE